MHRAVASERDSASQGACPPLLEASTEIQITRIRRDGETSGRVSLDAETVEHYAALMREDVVFPPVRVWFDGMDHWLSDGFQRVAAAERAGLTKISAEILTGSLSDAQWDSYAANSKHGLRLSNADLQAILSRALSHPRGAGMSNYQIAKHLGIPETTVRRWRRQLSTPIGADTERIAVRAGKQYKMKTEKIGKAPGACPRRGFKSRTELQQGLAEMKRNSSPAARRIINIFSNWVANGATAEECLLAIERFINEVTPAASAKPSPIAFSSNGSVASRRGNPATKTA